MFKRVAGPLATKEASFKVSYYTNEPIGSTCCRLRYNIAQYYNSLCLNRNHNSCGTRDSSLKCAKLHGELHSSRPDEPLFPDMRHLSGGTEEGPPRDFSTDQPHGKQHGPCFLFCFVCVCFLIQNDR